MLRKSASDLKQCLALIGEHAVSEAPRECCGIVLGQGPVGNKHSGPLEVFVCTNIQDEMHGRDPGAFKRNSTTAYFIDPSEQAEVFSVAPLSMALAYIGPSRSFYSVFIHAIAYFGLEHSFTLINNIFNSAMVIVHVANFLFFLRSETLDFFSPAHHVHTEAHA